MAQIRPLLLVITAALATACSIKPPREPSPPRFVVDDSLRTRLPAYRLSCNKGLICDNADSGTSVPASCTSENADRTCLKACRWTCALYDGRRGQLTVIARQRGIDGCWQIPKDEPFFLDGIRFEANNRCPHGVSLSE
ncbi:MAG: hypothetical protein ACPGSC_08080 [Granulosicoccaceae bacterium]